MVTRPRIIVWLQTGWLALGMALLGFLLLEGLYTGQRQVRARLFGSDDEREAQAAGHPYRGQAWFRQLLRERARQQKQFDPWRTWWSYPMSGTYINIDSAGRRRTIQAASDSAPAARVLMLGGSALWGFTVRDSLTIPSLVARDLGLRGWHVEVVNLAQPGFIIGQEVATLLHEVEGSGGPALAVFLDGINDIRSALLYTEPGHIFFEPRLRRLYEVDANRGLVSALLSLGEHSALINRLLLAVGANTEWREPPTPPDLCGRVAGYYRRQTETALALAAQGRFEVLFLQQPMHATTGKRLTAFEADLDGADRRARIRACAAAIDSAMAGGDPRRYVSLAAVLDREQETVFLDNYGHLTEAANALVAQRIAAEVASRLEARQGNSPR